MMKDFQEISIKDYTCNPFTQIGNEWMLITAEKDGKVNTMTASWGGLGVIWHYNAVYIFVRQSRFTKEFIDATDSFSLSFLDPAQYRKAQNYLGKVSGRDEDKIGKTGLTVAHAGAVPYFEEAETVMLCRKLSSHFLTPEGMIDEKILPRNYSNLDYHTMYVGEIRQILKKS